MIQKFVDAWMKNRDFIQSWLEPICLGCDYSAIVKATVRAIALETTGGYGDPKPDFENIHEINDGDYQGTLVYVIPEVGYQPSEYWYVRVSYGSCCCCDTLQGEQMNDKESCIKGVMTLSLHIVQQMRRMGGYEV